MSKSQFEIVISRAPSQVEDYKLKFKTEMCRNWKTGTCEYGEKCVFAHGTDELRVISSSNYKTKKCKQFHEKGYCQYGNRCQFRHRDLSQDTTASSPIAVTRERSQEGYGKRLPIFFKIAPQA